MPPSTKTPVYPDGPDHRRLNRLAREARRPRSLAAGKSGRPDFGQRAEELLAGFGCG